VKLLDKSTCAKGFACTFCKNDKQAKIQITFYADNYLTTLSEGGPFCCKEKRAGRTDSQTVDKAAFAIMQKPLFCSIETVQRRISLMNIKNM
jgi:hypothetical protein